MRIVAGVDCHKSSHTVVFLDEVGRVVMQLTIETSPEGYEAALDEADRLGCTEWGIEGSGCYGYAFAVFARARRATVLEVPGVYTKRHRRHGSRRGKSDANDAQAVAEVVLREPGRLPHFHGGQIQRGLRLRYDQRDRMVRERTRAVNRLRSFAVLFGVMRFPKDITSSRAARQLSAQAAEFREAVELDVASAAILDEVQDAADEILRLNGRIASVDRVLRQLVSDIAGELLRVHGVSIVAAAGIIGHAGDVRNIRSASAFAMKCGIAPVPCSSGRNAAVRVNTGGDRQLNRLLHIIAMSQVRRADHVGRVYYARKRAEGKTHLAAMRCLKRMLATVVYFRLIEVDRALLRTEQEFAEAS